jgi:putative copper export protein
LDAITGWALFGGLLVALGCVVARWVVIPRAPVPGDVWHERMLSELGRLGLAGAGVATAGVALALVRQLLEFRDPFVPWTEDAHLLLLGTAWGRIWILGASGAVLSIVAFAAAGAGRRSGWWFATLLALALGAFPAFTGHAAGDNPLRALLLAADVVHVWGAAAWIGGLAAVLWLEWRLAGGNEPSLLPALVPAFSRVAVVAVAAVVLTGALAGWAHLSGISALVDTTYGRTLGLKVALVAVVLALGATNFRVLTPRLGTDDGDRALRRAATVELLVAQVVLLVTAVLVRTSPGGM